MSSIRLHAAGSALVLALAFSTSAQAQLLPGLDLTNPASVLETLNDLVESVDAGVGGVDVGTGGDVTVTVLGDGGSPLTVDTGTILGTDAPSLTVTLPDLPVVSDVPSVVNTVTETVTDIVNVPDAITTVTNLVPDVINTITDIPDIIDIGGRDGDDDGDVTVINNQPPVINNPPTVVVIGDTRYPPIVPADPGDPKVPVLNPSDPQPRTLLVPRGQTTFFGSPGGGSPSHAMPRSSKLRMLLAILQGRGWLHFAANNGICLPPFAVTQVRDILNRREQRQLDGLLQTFANDIMQMRSLMANCRTGTRLTAGDINRVIGVGISANGTPVLYVL